MRHKLSIIQVFITLFLGLGAAVAIFPFYQTLMISFSTINDVGSGRLFLYPDSFNLSSYEYLFLEGKVTRGLLISIVVTIVGTALSLIVTAAGAYALSKKLLPGRNFVFYAIIFTMFFSGGLIPMYLLLQSLHMQNNLLVMILPAAVNAFNLILMKNFFNTVSTELEESAKMDGANDIVIFFRIIIPVSLPIIFTMILFYAVERWNDWWLPMLFLSDPKLYPLQLVLRNAISNMNQVINNTVGAQLAAGIHDIYGDSVKSAMIIISAVPIIMVYPFIQKYFASGIMLGSIKG
jgi:putative aldouronate transport system permease protein